MVGSPGSTERVDCCEDAMKYLLLIYNDDTLLDALPAGELDSLSRDRTDPTDS